MKIKSQHVRYVVLGIGFTLLLLGGFEWKFGQLLSESVKNTIVSTLFITGAMLYFFARSLDKKERESKSQDNTKK
jgi:hypothetical protein